MDTKERLQANRQKMQEIQQRLQAIEGEKQNSLQELLRLDGENRLLNEMARDGDKPKLTK